MNKIVVMSGKGGVGKSTVAANLAFKLADEGNNVGIFDSDFHGPSIPQMVGVKEGMLGARDEDTIEPVEVNENLQVFSMDFLLGNEDSAVIWRGPMKMKAIKQFIEKIQWGDLDFMIIDLPPGTGDEPLSVAQQITDISGAVIVTTPQDVSVQAVERSVGFAKKLDMKILGIVENMSGITCPNCGEEIDVFGEGGGESMAENVGEPFLGSIPLDPKIMESGEKGKTFLDEDSESSKAFQNIVENIYDRLEE